MHPIILVELAKFRQQDILREAESRRLASLVVGKKSDKMKKVRQIMINVVQGRINFRIVRDLKFRHSETLSPHS